MNNIRKFSIDQFSIDHREWPPHTDGRSYSVKGFMNDKVDARLSRTDIHELQQSSKVVLKRSDLHGYGIFATENIQNGEIIEEATFVLTSYKVKDLIHPEMAEFLLTYPCRCEECVMRGRPFIFTSGLAIQYNCCNKEIDTNVVFYYNLHTRIITTVAYSNIEKGQEILAYWGQGYYDVWISSQKQKKKIADVREWTIQYST